MSQQRKKNKGPADGNEKEAFNQPAAVNSLQRSGTMFLAASAGPAWKKKICHLLCVGFSGEVEAFS